MSVLLLSFMLKEQAIAACTEWGFSTEGNRDELIERLRVGLTAAGINPNTFDFISKSELVPRGQNAENAAKLTETLDVPAPSVFLLSPPSTVASRWEKWLKSFNIYVSALGGQLTPARKSALLLHVGGSKLQELKETLVLEENTEDDTFVALVKALNKYFMPRKSIRYERFLFRECCQQQNERTDAYVTRLRALCSHCDFVCSCKISLVDDMILDQVIQNCSSSDLRKKYLREENITLTRLLEIARAFEAADSQTANIEKKVASVASVRKSNKNNVGKSASSQVSDKIDCQFCDRSHVRGKDNCPARNSKCHTCDKVGHFSKSKRCKGKPKQNATTVRAVQSNSTYSDESSGEEVIISKLSDNSDNSVWRTHMLVNDKKVHFLLDGGATCNLLCSKFVPNNVELTSAQNLRMYDGTSLPVLGKVVLPVVNIANNTKYSVQFYVVADQNESVLGINALQKMDLVSLNHKNICTVSDEKVAATAELSDVLNRFEEVFGDDLGRIKGFKAKITLKDDAVPSFCRARPVPFALRPANRRRVRLSC